MLIQTIDQVREVVGNAIRKENTFDVLRPYLQQSEETMITGLIGSAQLTALAGTVTGSAEKLHTLVCRAIVWNGYLEAWYHTMYELSGSGVNRQKPDKTEALFRYQEDNIRKDIVQKADEAIEAMMEYLQTNSGDFAAWKNSDEYKSNYGYLLATPAALHTSLPEVSKSFRMYKVLRSYMARVERSTAKVVMGADLYSTLKDKLRDGDELTAHQKELHQLAADYVAPATLLEALPFIRVRFTTTGVRILTTVYNLNDELAIGDEQTRSLSGLLSDRADQAKAQLRKYLNATASSTVFPEYFNSKLYVAPGSREWKLPNNEGKKHFRL